MGREDEMPSSVISREVYVKGAAGSSGQIETAQNSLAALVGALPFDIARGRLEDVSFPDEVFDNQPLQATAARPDVRAAQFLIPFR